MSVICQCEVASLPCVFECGKSEQKTRKGSFYTSIIFSSFKIYVKGSNAYPIVVVAFVVFFRSFLRFVSDLSGLSFKISFMNFLSYFSLDLPNVRKQNPLFLSLLSFSNVYTRQCLEIITFTCYIDWHILRNMSRGALCMNFLWIVHFRVSKACQDYWGS